MQILRNLVVVLGSIATGGVALHQPELSASELAVIESGRQVVREERVRGSAWPRVTIHQFITATPLEAAAVFADYERHSAYLPGLRMASVSRRETPRVAEVDYVLSVPLFPDEAYTVRDSISRTDDGASYRVDWTMVRARSTKAIVGSARFRPHRNARAGVDGTLIIYDNLVIPGQALAGPLKARALRQARETVSALVAEVERARREEPGLLAAQVALLVEALAPPP